MNAPTTATTQPIKAPEAKPALRVSNPTHFVVVGVYVTAILIGIEQLTGIGQALSLNRILTEKLGPTLGAVLGNVVWVGAIAAGLAALSSGIVAKFPRTASTALLVEALGCTGIAITFGYYLVSLLAGNPNLLSTFTTKTLVGVPFVLFCAARTVQALRERHRLRLAKVNPRTADPVLAAQKG